MVKLEDAVIARLDTHGERYEVLVDPNLALDLKRNAEIDITTVLAVETIFKDAKKGEKASEEQMKKVFSTQDTLEIAEKIIKKGEIQLTTEQRKKMAENRKKQIISIIARNGINPQTNSPHPPHSIDKAIDEAKVKIEVSKTAEEQIKTVLKALRPIIPIKFEERSVACKIPASYTGKVVSIIKRFGDIKKEEWQKDGSWIFTMDLPAGVVEELFDELNSLTKGEVETKILKSS